MTIKVSTHPKGERTGSDRCSMKFVSNHPCTHRERKQPIRMAAGPEQQQAETYR